MLLDLRETIRNSKPIKYTLITVVCIPFALVGIGSYFAGGSAATVAKVNGEEITEQALESAYRAQRQRFAQMFGGQIPAAFDDETLLRRQALESLVTQRVVADEVVSQRFAVGDETLGKAIREREEFRVDERFDRERYEQLLGGQVAAFEAQFRDELALEQFRSGVVATSFMLPSEASRLNDLARQVRSVDAIRFDFAAALEATEVDEAAVVARFEEAADTFEFPPRAKIDYIELSVASMTNDIEVSDEEAQVWYEENRTRFMMPELREASHILFSVDDPTDEDAVADARAKALDAKARIDGGEAFDVVAKELSDDSGSAGGGGSLGAITPGSMVAPFEEAVYELDGEGSLSEPVVTEFGVHLIRVDKVAPESGRGFEEVKDEAIAAVRRDRADSEFFELREQLTELAFENPESLEAAADATGLDIQASDWLDVDTDAGPVLSNPAVREAIFSADVLEDGNNSEPVEIGGQHVVVLRVTEHEGTRPKTLDDVRESLTETLRAELAGEQLGAAASAAEEALASGADPLALAEAAEFATAIVDERLTRDATMFDRAAIGTIFAAPAPTDETPSTGSLTLAAGDRLAWRIGEVVTPPAEATTASDAPADAPTDQAADGNAAPVSPPATPLVEAGANAPLGNVEFGALMESLRAKADVELQP